jgi:tetratricopeptide (TPR) repeat protein
LADFYKILGLEHTADSTQIRTAYKRLAMQYHPDRNPGNPEAEEIFKLVNEAYHILSDPLKKSRYDSRHVANTISAHQTEAYWREMQRKQYARWQHTQKKRYTFDREYFRIQGLAFLVFLVMAGICFAIIHSANYYIALQRQEEWRQKRLLVMEVNLLFGSGKIDEAIETIIALHKKEPLEFQFVKARDSLVDELRYLAEQKFETRQYDSALHYLKPLKKYEYPPRAETLRKISVCEYNLGSYEDALVSLKQLFNQQPWNLELAYHIGMISLQYQNDLNEATHYFTIGKKIFKDNLTEAYGEAFVVVMDPKDVPDIYFEIFIASANTNVALKKYKEAEKDLNWAIHLRETRPEGYRLRAITHARARKFATVCSDLLKAQKFGATDVESLQQKYCR